MSSPSDDAITEKHIAQDSPFSEQSLPLINQPASSAVSSEQSTSPIKERRVSQVSMASQQSLPLPSDINFSDTDEDMLLPSEGSAHSRQPTPTIEALQEDYEDEEDSIASTVPESDHESVDGSEVGSESPVPTDEEEEEEEEEDDDDEEDEDSEVNDMFDPGFASPALSTREADTLTPTAHLFGTGTPTRGVFGMRTTPSRSLVEGRPSPLPESANESWLDSPPHSPPPPPPESPPPSPPQSPPPAPTNPPPIQSTPNVVAPSPSIVPSDSPTVQSMPSPVQRSTSGQSSESTTKGQTPDGVTSPGLSTDNPSPEPSFESGDESLPGFGSTLDSMGALTLSQTAFSTMGFGSDIELPDLPYVNPGK